jgi:membrane protease subunit HflC
MAYRQAQEIQGKADAEATRIYGEAFNRDPEFYAFSRTVEAYKDGVNRNSVLILTTNSDFYKYLKEAVPGGEQIMTAPAPRAPGQ